MVSSLMKSVEIKKLEQRIISLFDRTFSKAANVSKLDYRSELPRNTKRWFQSKTFETQFDFLLTEIIRLALSHADANVQESQVPASIPHVNKTAADKPYPLTAEVVRISIELAAEVADSIVQMLANDEIYYRNPNQLARQIEQYWNNERYRAIRLARTFTADVAVNSELYRYAQRGVQVEFFAETDDRTSPQCRALHGTVFDANSAEASRLRPPLHHNCRSDLLPVPVSRSVYPDRMYENRDFRRQMDQDGNFIDSLVDEKVVQDTFENIEVFNEKYRIDKFILDSDLEKRIAKDKGLIEGLIIPTDKL